ncbi:similar to Saccharomyces cerevisiae YER010C Protein of unknown function, forms a ring-shaped homotrimer [Maudiozyma barnettii]|uniref:RraA family protein n=1 Tax=Maudiozyma barnettii TaxID=61262 RepID=A0A8H2VEL4_9SACH|nr:bifunctional 4-hydroxy-4-methyl-2-oxoglutarate aldolase/oxaloacetate decarboxylase [Kazachstania barnettii]CAB4254091.1 similar to Saccharomyces cerevisiae YER010C Protein of unknown function, forms a ring-shaped homotrimer [Kazachstania barnettii]CAD1781841.1 similar to Saccharomyces cerevisiae YER010C Protein of unknown function, forms a ring-shaped homotrimer [Kazachstania barnettii]
MTDVQLETLSEFTTCDISDGLQNLYGIKDGGYFPNLCQRSGERKSGSTVGKAYTVLFAHASDERPAINYIDEIPSNSVLVMAYTPELQTSVAPYTYVNNAIFGGLMAARAQKQGVNGTVVFGRVRDVGEFTDLEYPVFSYGLSAVASKGVVKPVAINTSLSIATSSDIIPVDNSGQLISKSCGKRKIAIAIKEGDYIVCDIHGMTRIPHETVDLDRLITYIKGSIEVDTLIAQDILNGEPAEASKIKYRVALEKLKD